MLHTVMECKFTCSQCLKSYKQSHALKSHQLKHAGAALHSCDLCPKTFMEGYLLKRHINRIHIKSELFSCDQCTKPFNASSSLWYHRKIDSDERPYILECSEKTKSFNLKIPQPDSERRHSPDFRTVFRIMIGLFSFCEIGKT